MEAIDSLTALQTRQMTVSEPAAARTRFTGKLESFDTAMGSLDRVANSTGGGVSEMDDATKKLQAMFVSQMMSELFREQTASTFGEGPQGDFYASVFADAVAEKMADQDILGFGQFLNVK